MRLNRVGADGGHQKPEGEADQRVAEHPPLRMLRQRLYGILADYEDCNDHDACTTSEECVLGTCDGGTAIADATGGNNNLAFVS